MHPFRYGRRDARRNRSAWPVLRHPGNIVGQHAGNDLLPNELGAFGRVPMVHAGMIRGEIALSDGRLSDAVDQHGKMQHIAVDFARQRDQRMKQCVHRSKG